MAELKFGLAQGYWSAGPQPNFVEMAQEAERLGYDSRSEERGVGK